MLTLCPNGHTAVKINNILRDLDHTRIVCKENYVCLENHFTGQILILRLPKNTSDDDLFLLMHANVNLM